MLTDTVSYLAGSTFPSTPNEGETFFNTDKKLYLYKEGQWKEFGNGSGTGSSEQRLVLNKATLTTSATELYAYSNGVVIDEIILCNVSNADATVTVFTGSSANAPADILKTVTVQFGQTLILDSSIILKTGESLYALSSANNSITVAISGTAKSMVNLYKNVMAATNTPLFTSTAETVITDILACNSGSDTLVDIYVKHPNSPESIYIVKNFALGANQTLIIDFDMAVPNGSEVYAKGSVNTILTINGVQ